MTRIIDQVRENFRRVGHLQEVRTGYDVRYHVEPNQVAEFQREIQAIHQAEESYRQTNSAADRNLVNQLFEAFQEKWAQNRTSI